MRKLESLQEGRAGAAGRTRDLTPPALLFAGLDTFERLYSSSEAASPHSACSCIGCDGKKKRSTQSSVRPTTPIVVRPERYFRGFRG